MTVGNWQRIAWRNSQLYHSSAEPPSRCRRGQLIESCARCNPRGGASGAVIATRKGQPGYIAWLLSPNVSAAQGGAFVIVVWGRIHVVSLNRFEWWGL